jgi:hypothetical protein
MRGQSLVAMPAAAGEGEGKGMNDAVIVAGHRKQRQALHCHGWCFLHREMISDTVVAILPQRHRLSRGKGKRCHAVILTTRYRLPIGAAKRCHVDNITMVSLTEPQRKRHRYADFCLTASLSRRRRAHA